MLLSVKQHHFPNLRCAYTSLSRGPTSLQHPALRGMKRGRPKGWGPNKDDSEVDDEKNNSKNNNNNDNKSGSLENSAAAFNAVQVLQSGPMARMTPYVNTEVGRIKDGGLVGSSTAFTYRILGTETQIVEVNLTPGAAVRAGISIDITLLRVYIFR